MRGKLTLTQVRYECILVAGKFHVPAAAHQVLRQVLLSSVEGSPSL
jgi:hypothetical protein